MKANDKLIGCIIVEKEYPHTPIGVVHHFEGQKVAYAQGMNFPPGEMTGEWVGPIRYAWLRRVTLYEPPKMGGGIVRYAGQDFSTIQEAIDAINKETPSRKHKVRILPAGPMKAVKRRIARKE